MPTQVKQYGLSLNDAGVTYDMAVDGSSTTQTYIATVPDGANWRVLGLVVMLLDDAEFTPGEFAGIFDGGSPLNNPLTNGVSIRILDDTTVERDFADERQGGNIKTTEQLMSMFSQDQTMDIMPGTPGEPGGYPVFKGMLMSPAASRRNDGLAEMAETLSVEVDIDDDLSTVIYFTMHVIVEEETDI